MAAPTVPGRRSSIVDATVRLFSAKGYLATTVRDIAEAVGLLPGSLYVHIDSKESLLLELVEGGIDHFLVACTPPATSGRPAHHRLRDVIVAYMQVAGSEPERTLVALHQWKYLTGPGRDRVIEKRRRFEALFRGIVSDGIAEGNFSSSVSERVAVLMIIGTLNWVPEWLTPQRGEGPEQVGQQFADIVLNGLGRSPHA